MVRIKQIFADFFKVFLIPFLLFACNNDAGNENIFNGDWSIFRGNPSLSGFTCVSLPDNPALLWSFNSDSNTKSSPVVYQNVVYWSNRRGHIFGVNSEGKPVFEYQMETAVDATPMINDTVLYIGRIDGKLYAVSLTRQDTLWSFETDGQIIASPNRVAFNGKEAIIVGSYDNYLYSLDSKSGKELNRFESGYYINGAVALSNQYAVYGGCDGWFSVVDCISGIKTDSLDIAYYIPASPAVYNNWCYVAEHSGNVYEIELDEGKIISSKIILKPREENGNFVSVPAVSDKMVFVVSDDRHIYAVSRKVHAITWKYLLKGDTGDSSPVICNDKLLVCTKTGIISILDAKTGKLLWEYDTGEQILASPAVINGCFFVLTFKGRLLCFGSQSSKSK